MMIGKYSIEEHGDGYALYLGRDQDHHGLRLCNLSDFDSNKENIIKTIVDSLNRNIVDIDKEIYDDPICPECGCKEWYFNECADCGYIDIDRSNPYNE